MKNKYTYNILKIIFSLIIIIPIVSLVGIWLGYDIQPKPEYYTNMEAYNFIKILMDTQYITIINALVFSVGLLMLWTKRTALASVIIFPITLNVVAFHAFVDGGLLTGGAMMGNLMLAINLYFFWYHFPKYSDLLKLDDK